MCLKSAHSGYPRPLLSNGYEIHSIEGRVRVGGRNVTPDIIMTSVTHGHSLVVDCKSGANVDLAQDRRYGQMTIDDLWGSGVPRSIRGHAPVYAINEGHVSRVREHTGHALIVFGSRSIYGIGDLGDAELTRELRAGMKIKKGDSPDTSVYPFSIRDSDHDVDMHVAAAIARYLDDHQGMASRSLATRAAATAVLRRAHPLYGRLSRPHRTELRRAVMRSIVRQEASGTARWWHDAAR